MTILIWFVFIYVLSQVEELEQQSCKYLLNLIQDEGMKPNYQYDVRAWISNECWKWLKING